MMELVTSALGSSWEFLSHRAFAHVDFLSRPHDLFDGSGGWIFLLNWTVQFVCSWVAFSIYIVWDYKNYKAGLLESSKLPSRHPMIPFWWSQLRMVPIVLYNQLVVWPLVVLLLIWPQWVISQTPASSWPGGYLSLVVSLIVLLLISDQMWYWSHRLMHTKWCWKHLHKLHHVAENTAISATYVHPIEYAMFTVAMNLPFALTGFPYPIHLVFMGWGMFTGSGAHSGYSGDFANGDKHNAHHLFHNCNFGLLMVADIMYGTHWAPGDPAPKVWSEAVKIWNDPKYAKVHGSEAASTFLPKTEEEKEAMRAKAKKRAGCDNDLSEEALGGIDAIEALALGKVTATAAKVVGVIQ